MGNSNKKDDLINNIHEKNKEILKEKKDLKNKLLIDEINNRGMIDNNKKKSSKKNNPSKNARFEIKIFLYFNESINEGIINSIKQYNSQVFNWKITVLCGFSQENNKILLDICENDFKDNNFKDVIIIPIKSISDFHNKIEQDGYDIFEPFNDLTEEQQPFFLIIDEDKDDFIEYQALIEVGYSTINKEEFDYKKFNGDIVNYINSYKRKEYDYELKIDFIIEINEKINTFKEYISYLNTDKGDLEIYINNKLK